MIKLKTHKKKFRKNEAITIFSIILMIVGIIIPVIMEAVQSQKAREPQFIWNIYEKDNTRFYELKNEGGAITESKGRIYYMVDYISAQDVNNATQAIFIYEIQDMSFYLKTNLLMCKENLNDREMIFCEAYQYLKEESEPIAIVPFIYSYIDISYKDFKGKSHNIVYFINEDGLEKSTEKQMSKKIKIAEECAPKESYSLWNFYNYNRKKLGLHSQLKRDKALTDTERTKSIEDYVEMTCVSLDENTKAEVVQLLKEFAGTKSVSKIEN